MHASLRGELDGGREDPAEEGNLADERSAIATNFTS